MRQNQLLVGFLPLKMCRVYLESAAQLTAIIHLISPLNGRTVCCSARVLSSILKRKGRKKERHHHSEKCKNFTR